mmetsp:Transcript_37636/g.94039  ORF Transcript_37636/g.94039 Transcript_37636/m.94039 type:complete len:96 (+) Transcript_37636:140-427(+)
MQRPTGAPGGAQATDRTQLDHPVDHPPLFGGQSRPSHRRYACPAAMLSGPMHGTELRPSLALPARSVPIAPRPSLAPSWKAVTARCSATMSTGFK